MELIKIIMGLICFQIDKVKKELETEGKPNDIASLQGKLKGLRIYEEAMIENLTYFDFWDPIEVLKVSTIKNSVLKLLVNQVEDSEKDERWISIKNMVDSEIEEMKNFLLFRAGNSRSLFLTHGKKNGLYLSRELKKEIIDEFDWRVERGKERKEDEPLLQRMIDPDKVEEVVDSVDAFESLFMSTEEVIND